MDYKTDRDVTEETAEQFRIHQLDLRKGTTIPYISHLMAVTALVLESGGD